MDSISVEIKPNPAACGAAVKLNPIDQIAPRNHTVFYWFFKLPKDADKQRIAKCMEEGLVNAIAEVPQAMCSVTAGTSGREELRLVYEASGGAAFNVRDYTSPALRDGWRHGSFSDLGRQHFPLSELDYTLIQGPTNIPGTQNTRCTSLQINFIEGGMILTLMLHHLMCDGTGMRIFIHGLGLHTAAQYRDETPTITPAVNFSDRHTAIPTLQEDVSLGEFPNWKLVHTVANHTEAASPANPSSKDCLVKHSIYFISRKGLDRLRTRLTSSVFQPSRMEALSSFLWVSTIRARNVDPGHYPEAKLSVAVDTRRRMTDSAISPTYWGNMSEPNAVARLPTKFMLGLDNPIVNKPSFWDVVLPEAAKRIRNAIDAVDSKAVQRLAALLNQMPKTTSLTWNVDRWPGPDMLICCLNLFRFNDVDFGPEIGKSVAFRNTIGKPGAPDGRCIILPPRGEDDGGLEVSLQYDTKTLERLGQDRNFTEFFEWRN